MLTWLLLTVVMRAKKFPSRLPHIWGEVFVTVGGSGPHPVQSSSPLCPRTKNKIDMFGYLVDLGVAAVKST